MIWQSPWAALGLVTLLLPILIHLLGRGRSRVLRFPTLRFIHASRLLPARRTRLHDLLLLLVRLAILLAAVAALAQPLWRSTARRRTVGQSLARAILVDTSASMDRPAKGGTPARIAARTEAARLAAEAPTNLIVETADLVSALPGATFWLERQGGRAELVLISDFQRGAIDSTALAAVRVEIGVHLDRIEVVANAPLVLHTRVGSSDIAAAMTTDDDRTDVTWTWQPAATASGGTTLLAPVSDSAQLLAASDAARAIGEPMRLDTAHAVAVLFPHAAEWVALRAHAVALKQPWMTTLALGVHDDPLLRDAATTATASDDSMPTAGLTLARDASGASLVVAAAEGATKGSRLLLFVRDGAGSPLSAALIVATRRMLGDGLPVGELDPTTIPEARLAAWQRPSTEHARREVRSGNTIEASDGRWFWLLALLLLGVEGWLRKRTAVIEVVPDANA